MRVNGSSPGSASENEVARDCENEPPVHNNVAKQIVEEPRVNDGYRDANAGSHPEFPRQSNASATGAWLFFAGNGVDDFPLWIVLFSHRRISRNACCLKCMAFARNCFWSTEQ